MKDRRQSTGFFLHICSDVIGTLCDADKDSGCEIVNMKWVLWGSLFKIIDRPESFLNGPPLTVWEENVHNIIPIGLEEGREGNEGSISAGNIHCWEGHICLHGCHLLCKSPALRPSGIQERNRRIRHRNRNLTPSRYCLYIEKPEYSASMRQRTLRGKYEVHSQNWIHPLSFKQNLKQS